MTLSDRQREAIAFGASDLALQTCEGGVRSGKTFASSLGWALWALNAMRDADHLIVGRTVESVMRNVVECPRGLVSIFRSFGYDPRIVIQNGQRLEVPTTSGRLRAYITGANDRRSHMRIQGATFGGAFIDEGPLVPEPFWNMVLSRLSVAGSKAWVTLNPESPAHWWFRTVNERIDALQGRVLRFDLADNPSLDERFKGRLAASYTGHWKRRFIFGEWAAPSGLVFPAFSTTTETPESGRWDFGLDFAFSSVLAVLAFRGGVCVGELIHDAVESGQLEMDVMNERITDWAKSIGAPRLSHVWVDPSTPPLFKRRLRGYFTVRNADNAVSPGIMTTATRLASGDIRIHERCRYLVRELQSYSWDEKAAEHGEDAPAHAHSHAPDALRYFAHSTGKVAGTVGPAPLADVLR